MHTTDLRPRHAVRFSAAALAAVLTAGCAGGTAPDRAAGGAGPGADPAVPAGTRMVDVTMTDNAFEPRELVVRKGDTVTFRFTNRGALDHEAVLGDEATQERHHGEMSAGAGAMDHSAAGPMDHSAPAPMDHDGAEPGAVTVRPGATGDVTRTFDESTTVLVGCHEPGHWESGMRATIRVM